MEEMLHHTKAVARGAEHAMVVGDMPFMSFQASRGGRRAQRRPLDQGGRRARGQGRGPAARPGPRLVEHRHPGHGARGAHAAIGLRAGRLPKVQGRGEAADEGPGAGDRNWRRPARSRSCSRRMPADLGDGDHALRCRSRRSASAPGPGYDAQVLVIHDLLGLTEKPPKLAKAYADLRGTITRGGRGVRRTTSSAGDVPRRGPQLLVDRRPGSQGLCYGARARS